MVEKSSEDRGNGAPGRETWHRGVLGRGRNYFDQAKVTAAEFALSEALGLMGKSDESYTRIARAIGTVARNRSQKSVAEWTADFLAPGSPGSQYLKRIISSIHPNFRRKYIARFLTSIIFHDRNDNYEMEDGTQIPVPASLVVSPTMRCNLSCVGCYAGNYSKEDDMTPELLESVIRQAREIGTRFFIIVGGEPLVYQPLFDILEKFTDCAFQFYTSGHLLTDRVIDRLVKMGNVVPAISIEGFEALHDARRGEGSFKRVMAAMDKLREARALFCYSATITRHNVEDATCDEFIDLMIEKGAGYGWYFSYIPVGRGPDMEYMPTPSQRNHLRAAVERIRRTKPILLADFWNDGPLTEGCLAAGRRYLHINSKGDVEPCVFIHFATHNLHTTSLKEALASEFFRTLRSGQPYDKNLLLPCPIIDHPRILRRVVGKTGAYPTHEGAKGVLTELAEPLNQYAASLKEIYDEVWESAEYRWTEVLYGDRYKLRRKTAAMSSSLEMAIVGDGDD